jgi:hypothetical protein
MCHNVINDLILQRILPSRRQDWLEKGMMTRIWISSQQEAINEPNALGELFDTIKRSASQRFSAITCHAIQTVLPSIYQ